MAKVSLHIIKDWFRNQQKPPQEKFWAWLDSFWHKDEPIPQSAIENLATTLQKKADLVGGKVPESQLPFSVVTSEVIALGKVEIVGSTLTLNVHSNGSNRVRVKGQEIVRTFPNSWDFMPVQNGGVKVLRGYAVKGETDFFLAEGPELPEYEKPEIPPEALQLFEVTITEFEVSVDTGDGGAKTRADDAWKTILLNRDTPRTLFMDEAGSNFILEGNYAATITGVVAKTDAYIWEGKQFIIRNNTGNDIQLDSAGITPDLTIVRLPFTTATVLKRNMDALVMVRNGALVVVRFGSGGGNAEFPEGGNVGDPLVRKADGGVEFSNAIPAAIDAETVNRAAEDLAEKNARIAADNAEALARANADALKLDKSAVENSFLGGTTKALSAEQGKILNTNQITISGGVNFNTNTVGSITGLPQSGRNVRVDNGVNNVTITVLETSDANFIASYMKFGAGNITFYAGANVTVKPMNGVSTISGGEGSAACLERFGNTFYLYITNV